MTRKGEAARLWRDFRETLAGVPEGRPEVLAATLQAWLSASLERFGESLLRAYRVREHFLDLDLAEYPVQYAEVDLAGLRAVFERLAPSTVEDVLARVSEVAWNLVAYQTDVTCPRCGDDELRGLYDPAEDSVVLACDICDWSQLPSGQPWTGRSGLVPARTVLLGEYTRRSASSSRGNGRR